MPTITQLPAADEVAAGDSVPLSQGGTAHSVSVGTLLAGTQPAIMADTGTLLGRVSLGPGGPEAITVGAGLVLNEGTLVADSFNPARVAQQTTLTASDHVMLNSQGSLTQLPATALRGLFSAGKNISIDDKGTISASGAGSASDYSITTLPSVATIAGTDMVAISQSGTDHTISYANLLDGLTIDLAQPALPATDADTLWVAQGSSTMLRQTFAAIWSWLASKQPTYKIPVVEVTTDTNLDGIAHNGRILICSQPVTLTPVPLNMGSGFHCEVINLSSGNVTFGSGVLTSSGTSILSSGQAAALCVVSYSAGTVVFASLGGNAGGGTLPAPPGQVIGLTAGSPTSNSITLNWSAPGSGGPVSTYTVQYRVTGGTTWTTFSAAASGTSLLVTGLSASTAYDFQVNAVNSGGSGPSSSIANATTAAAAGSVTSVSWLTVPIGPYARGSGAIGVNAHINPGNAAVKFGFSSSATVSPPSWVDATYVNTDIWGAYVTTPATAGTWYVWVEGKDGSLPTVYATPFVTT